MNCAGCDGPISEEKPGWPETFPIVAWDGWPDSPEPGTKYVFHNEECVARWRKKWEEDHA